MSNELAVISKSKDLAEYVIDITEKSPKKFRMTLIMRMQNYCIVILENLYRANSIRIIDKETAIERKNYQKEAKVTLDMLCTVAEIAKNQQCIQPKHFFNICTKSAEIRKLIYAWARSDNKVWESI